MFKEIKQCRICGCAELVPILSLGNQYLTGVFPRTSSERVTCGPLELVKCHGEAACGLLQLRHCYDPSELYGANYGYRSSLNRSMVEHLKAKVGSLLARFPLSDSDLVMDIGSNDGTLLAFYPESVTRVGMDPTAAKFREFYKPGIQVITDFFSTAAFRARFGGRKARIVTSIAMFYDLERPMDFAGQVASVLADDGIWHFEQSYMPTMLERNAYDAVCHEHLEYYGLKQIQWMMDRCGLKILDIELNDMNGGSFAVTVSKTSAPYQPNCGTIAHTRNVERAAELDTLKPYEAFKSRVFQHRDQLVELLKSLSAQDAKVLGYGASTKGNVILQFCGLTPKHLPGIAEVNREKFGRFTPGTLIPIISEADAHAMRPDHLLVLPWHFKQNLMARESAFLQRGGKMIFPMPEIEIVGK
jgi:hypothetical protein